MKHFFYVAPAWLVLIGSLHMANVSIAVDLNAQETVTPEESKKTEERKPVHLEKLTIIFEGEEVLKQEGIHEWAGKAGKIVTECYPKFDKLLESEGYTPPKEMSIIFRKMAGVAFSTGTQIVISADWIKQQPQDFGMVAHELVHIIQRYPGGRGEGGAPGWVTEGIADYIRHAHFEPDVQMRPVNPTQIKYTDQYQITAGFFMWIEHIYDKEFVTKLNAHARQRTYSDDLFEKYNGKNLDNLWAEYVEFLQQQPGNTPRLKPSEVFNRKK